MSKANANGKRNKEKEFNEKQTLQHFLSVYRQIKEPIKIYQSALG